MFPEEDERSNDVFVLQLLLFFLLGIQGSLNVNNKSFTLFCK